MSKVATAEDEISVEELRAKAENPNFNLTAVLQNPRDKEGKTFYEELMDFDPFTFDFERVFKVNRACYAI